MNRERAEQYQTEYLADYGFEGVMVHYRRRLLLERLALHRPKVVVEIGCGSELLYEAWARQGGAVDCWVVVEPASQFAAGARQSTLPNLHVIEDFFETAQPAVSAALTRTPDLVICSGLLHEVPSADALLLAIVQSMGAGTRLHVNVPNATSMHRRLAVAMGLIDDPKAMSDRNLKLLQHRVYDIASLHEDLKMAGLAVTDQGGYFVKPFTHGQMELITQQLGEVVLDGCYELGKTHPEWGSEIYAEARKPNI